MSIDIIESGANRESLCSIVFTPTLYADIIREQNSNQKLNRIREKVRQGPALGFEIFQDGSLHFKGRWCIPSQCTELKRLVLDEAHRTLYSVHPGAAKLYKDLKQSFWWTGMKREVAEYVAGASLSRK